MVEELTAVGLALGLDIRADVDPVDLYISISALSAHYLPELGEPFTTAGCCLYRDGRDSVAWHGDTIGRGRVDAHAGFHRPELLELLALFQRGGRQLEVLKLALGQPR